VGTGFSDKQREAPPPIGSIITFRYQELSDAGVPRFPSFVGVRIDAKPATAPPKVQAVPVKEKMVMATSASQPAGAKRYFEFVDGKSNKFWEVWVSGGDMTTRWGRIGTDGQTKTKTFASPDKAQAEADKLIEEKTGKGYVEK
ncbi:MAG TPA: WGR domain-containing protein, partial [Gemmataceae bacterium]|nr:WGR domain-containing protein [Gemmataceae bacterium]